MKTIFEQIKELVIEEYKEYDGLLSGTIEFENEINECTSLSEILSVLKDYGFDFSDGFDFIDNCISK